MTISFFSAFLAGLLTFLSPCLLPLAPVFIASLISDNQGARWARLKATAGFAAGFALVFTLLGIGVAALQTRVQAAQPVLLAIAGILLMAFAGRMMGWWSGELFDQRFSQWFSGGILDRFARRLPKGGTRSFVFGAAFATTWTPCVGPVLGGVLTYAAAQKNSPFESALLLLSFSAGIAFPLLALAGFSERLNPLFARWKTRLPKIEHALGFAMALFAGYVLGQAMNHSARLTADSSVTLTATTPTGARITIADPKRQTIQMLFFHTETCPLCKMMERYLPQFERDCRIAGFEFIKINVQDRANEVLADRFKIHAVPTLSVLGPDGAEVIRLVGYQTEGRLRDAVEQLMQRKCAR